MERELGCGWSGVCWGWGLHVAAWGGSLPVLLQPVSKSVVFCGEAKPITDREATQIRYLFKYRLQNLNWRIGSGYFVGLATVSKDVDGTHRRTGWLRQEGWYWTPLVT